MLEIVVSGVLGIIGAIIGAFISYIFTRTKYRLEIKGLEIEVSRYELEREKMRLELEKLKAEIDLMRRQEMKLLTDEFWKKMGARVEQLRADRRELPWLTLREAFCETVRLEGQEVPTASVRLATSIEELSTLYAGKKLLDRELACALADIEEYEKEIVDLEHQLYFQMREFDELPYGERERIRASFESEQILLGRLRHKLTNLKRRILLVSFEPGMSLYGADLEYCNLSGINLSRARLVGVNFRDANLRQVNFEYANLEDANLFRAKLSGANLRGACLRRADLEYAELRGANLEEADLSRADLHQTDFTEANLHNAILTGARYSKETLWPDGFDPKAAGAHKE